MKTILPTTISHELLYADLTYGIRGAIFNVYNELGFGHKEQVYQKALAKEFEIQSLPFTREQNLKVQYRDEIVGFYRPDFVVDEKVIVELKSLPSLPSSLDTQLLHYLKTTNFSLGLLVNFGTPKLFIKRLVWSPDQHKSASNPGKIGTDHQRISAENR